ncbi:M23 family metallopeptidase [Bergeyella sp. RCAD1439]|uniref:M23 family metallopeptidase n=1 Tax=Bergeyella anatis TaxID=3113737 RepID=UPI002E17650E|nr:M23 family metallopeptidase [Bergeyella sp. RCAD1439]
MKKTFFNLKKKPSLYLILLLLVFAQALVIGKLYSEKDHRNYEVHLVQINTEKDSVDYLKMKNDLTQIDHTIKQLNQFLKTKNIPNEKIEALDQNHLANSVYLAKTSNRYSQYLVYLQEKLKQIPLGLPTSGYISSAFGLRKNPIPSKPTLAMASASSRNLARTPSKPSAKKDSLDQAPQTQTNLLTEKKTAPSKEEAEPAQFHKGIDFAVPHGSDVRSTAMGTVIFAGLKGGYGKCVIIAHGNGLATLYGHLSEILVQTNDQVNVNQIIAKSGNSGRSTGPHLHYEVHKNQTPINPKLFLSL